MPGQGEASSPAVRLQTPPVGISGKGGPEQEVALGFATTTLPDPPPISSPQPVPLSSSPRLLGKLPQLQHPPQHRELHHTPAAPTSLPCSRAPVGPLDCGTQAHHQLGYNPLHCCLCCHLGPSCWAPRLHHSKPFCLLPNPSSSLTLPIPASHFPQTSCPSPISPVPTMTLLLSCFEPHLFLQPPSPT